MVDYCIYTHWSHDSESNTDGVTPAHLLIQTIHANVYYMPMCITSQWKDKYLTR